MEGVMASCGQLWTLPWGAGCKQQLLQEPLERCDCCLYEKTFLMFGEKWGALLPKLPKSKNGSLSVSSSVPAGTSCMLSLLS